jgi:hypothetical protein
MREFRMRQEDAALEDTWQLSIYCKYPGSFLFTVSIFSGSFLFTVSIFSDSFIFTVSIFSGSFLFTVSIFSGSFIFTVSIFSGSFLFTVSIVSGSCPEIWSIGYVPAVLIFITSPLFQVSF